eukprot:1420632-Rhodomonas_salina.1
MVVLPPPRHVSAGRRATSARRPAAYMVQMHGVLAVVVVPCHRGEELRVHQLVPERRVMVLFINVKLGVRGVLSDVFARLAVLARHMRLPQQTQPHTSFSIRHHARSSPLSHPKDTRLTDPTAAHSRNCSRHSPVCNHFSPCCRPREVLSAS